MKLKTKLSKLRHDGHITNAEYAIIINALNKSATQPPKTQPCEDAVSRAALLEELGEEPFNWNDSPEAIQEVRDYQWFRSLVENAQPVTPKRSTGKWIVHPKGVYAHLVCSKCLCNAPLDCKTNYCPNCGAKMVESEE